MIKSIQLLINSDIFLIIFTIFTLTVFFLVIIIGLWMGRQSYIKKMDKFFLGQAIDSGIFFNLQRAGSYGAAMLFPRIIGKRLYKNVSISLIENTDKWPFMLYTSLLLLTIPVLFIATLY